MRIGTSVTSVSWIPSEAVTGLNKTVFDSGVAHYDMPPPDHIEDLIALRDADGFRFANRLAAWIEVVDDRIVDAGYDGGGLMGATTVRVGKKAATFEAVSLADIQRDPERTTDSVRFVQTTGGRTALPAPRRVNRPPFVQFRAPTVWITLALTVHADGSAEREVVGASPFPRHWIYDESLDLVEKIGLADFKGWYRRSFGKKTPWGDEESPALVTAVETALERSLSTSILRGGAKPDVRTIKAGKTLVEQGEPGDELFLVLDGVLVVEVDGAPVAELGPGAVLGERAVLEGGRRTSTLRAVTKCRVAAVGSDALDRDALAELRTGHERERRGA
ncbi:MAG: cyclic nucleotide-binding domain-containing protein [Acidimicrobiia bacterium]